MLPLGSRRGANLRLLRRMRRELLRGVTLRAGFRAQLRASQSPATAH